MHTDTPSNGRNILSVKNLSVQYKDRWALKDVSFGVNSDEIIGIIGPNGAGKTTLVKALTRKLKPASGDIELVAGRRKGRAHGQTPIAIAPQNQGLYAHLTAKENIGVLCAMAGSGRAVSRDKTDALLAAVDLTDRKNALARTLSGGMQQRLSFAVALACDPALLVLDEPASGVDASARSKLRSAMRAHAQQGNGVILVTHDHLEAQTLCARVAILAQGQCRYFDRPDAIIADIFGARMEVIASFSMPPDDALQETLKGAGFCPLDDWTWVAVRSDIGDDLTVPADIARAFGPIASSLSVRRPDLRSVMREITQPVKAA